MPGSIAGGLQYTCCETRATRASRLLLSSSPIGVDDLEDVAVDRLSEEEAFERRRAERLDDRRTFVREPPLQLREVGARMEHRDVAAELAFERRHGESLHMEYVQFLAAPDLEPERLHR